MSLNVSSVQSFVFFSPWSPVLPFLFVPPLLVHVSSAPLLYRWTVLFQDLRSSRWWCCSLGSSFLLPVLKLPGCPPGVEWRARLWTLNVDWSRRLEGPLSGQADLYFSLHLIALGCFCVLVILNSKTESGYSSSHFIQDWLNCKEVLIYCELLAQWRKSTFCVVFNGLCFLEGESGSFSFPFSLERQWLEKENTENEQMGKMSVVRHRNTRKYCFNYS